MENCPNERKLKISRKRKKERDEEKSCRVKEDLRDIKLTIIHGHYLDLSSNKKDSKVLFKQLEKCEPWIFDNKKLPLTLVLEMNGANS